MITEAAGYQKIDGTTGTPMGGVGSGAIKFCSWNGSFALADVTINNINFAKVSDMRFQFFSNRGGTVKTADTLKSVLVGGAYDDDAVYPIQTANFGVINGVTVSLLSFSPIDFSKIDNMCYPIAMYEITLANTQNSAVDASVALLLPTNGTPTVIAGKGIGSTASHGRAACVSTEAENPVFSCGNDNGFITGGVCNNNLGATTNKVAMKISLGANETKHINFVIAWYNSANGYTDRFYYANLCQNASAAAEKGLSLFSTYKKNALLIVNSMRGSNLPDWLVNQTLNTLSLLTNNSIYMKDGRCIYTEGQWNTNGTMDQMWAGRFINYQMFPQIAWNELEYWARTQRTSPDTADGQIHHDMQGGGNGSIVSWDQSVHPDGSFGANADWIDLNCNYIVSVYENYIATDDSSKLAYHWPHVKRAAQRIVKQLKYLDNKTYPCTFSDSSRNTYDVGGTYPFYNATLASLAFKVMSAFADIKSEPSIKTQFDSLYKISVSSFEKRWLTNNFPNGLHCECIATGQWMAFLLGLGEMYPSEKITYMLDCMKTYYKNPETAGLPNAGYNEWAPYIVSHYGGLCIQTGRFAEWKGLQKDWFDRTFNNRNLVFNIELGIPTKVSNPVYPATDISGGNEYMSDPTIWRNYYDLAGFRRNAHSREIAIEPKPAPEMNHAVTNAVVFIPEGTATINYSESGTSFLTQKISIAASNPIPVSKLYVRDKYGSDVKTVQVNNAPVTFTRVGSGFAKELCLNWSGMIGPEGVHIVVSDEAVSTLRPTASDRMKSTAPKTLLFSGDKFTLPESFSGKAVNVSVYDLAGHQIGTITTNKKTLSRKEDIKGSEKVYIMKIQPIR